MQYAVVVLKATRGSQLPISIYEIKTYDRKKLAQGETRAHVKSTFDMLERHFPDCAINYYQYDDYYVFILEDVEGIFHEVHIFMKEIHDD